ncbi:MAG: CerR family C-terminal domain-containing protein [Armatimonadota bacterium]
MKTRKDGEATRNAILDAACKVFGEKGFHKATHAEISREAGVNTALINFHFGSKDELYRKVWERVSKNLNELYPIDGNIPATAPAEERLYGHIRSLLNRALDTRMEGFHRIRTMESINPTGLLDKDRAERMQKSRAYTLALVRELLGPDATDQTVELCEMSVISQCMVILRPLGCKSKRLHHRFKHSDVDSLTRHITKFSLAGINAIKNREKDRKP